MNETSGVSRSSPNFFDFNKPTEVMDIEEESYENSSSQDLYEHLFAVEKAQKILSNAMLHRPLGKIEWENQHLSALHQKEMTEGLEKKAAQYQTTLWGCLMMIKDVFNVIFGGYLAIATPAQAAGCTLATASLLSLANSILVQAQKYEKIAESLSPNDETRKQWIALMVPLLIQVVTAIVTLNTLVRVGVIDLNLDRAVQKLKTITEWLTAAMGLGKGYSDFCLFRSINKELKTGKEVFSHEKIVQKLSKEVEELMHFAQEASRSLKDAIKASIRENQELTKIIRA